MQVLGGWRWACEPCDGNRCQIFNLGVVDRPPSSIPIFCLPTTDWPTQEKHIRTRNDVCKDIKVMTPLFVLTRLGASVRRVSVWHTVHYEYMALAKKTSVLREAMLLCVEPAWSAVNNERCAPQSMRTYFEAMLNKDSTLVCSIPAIHS